MNLVLGSASPRRQQLMSQFGFSFTVAQAGIDEIESGSPINVVQANAKAKSDSVFERHPESLVIGADTIVVCEGRILGKPSSSEDARQMLTFLSGRSHEVITAVALQNRERIHLFMEQTIVKFRPILLEELSCYIATGEPFDKAGSYGIQGFGGLFVESISGCYYNVVGLPMPRLVLALRDFGIDVFSFALGRT